MGTSHPLGHSPNGSHGLGRARPRPGAWNSIQVSQRVGRNTRTGTVSAAFPGTGAGGQIASRAAGLDWRPYGMTQAPQAAAIPGANGVTFPLHVRKLGASRTQQLEQHWVLASAEPRRTGALGGGRAPCPQLPPLPEALTVLSFHSTGSCRLQLISSAAQSRTY